jgi:hypothetical protein
MCWSVEITVAAASAESIFFLGLLCRGRRYDRPNALLILPLLIQEWLQVIWRLELLHDDGDGGDDDDDDFSLCYDRSLKHRWCSCPFQPFNFHHQ